MKVLHVFRYKMHRRLLIGDQRSALSPGIRHTKLHDAIDRDLRHDASATKSQVVDVLTITETQSGDPSFNYDELVREQKKTWHLPAGEHTVRAISITRDGMCLDLDDGYFFQQTPIQEEFWDLWWDKSGSIDLFGDEAAITLIEWTRHKSGPFEFEAKCAVELLKSSRTSIRSLVCVCPRVLKHPLMTEYLVARELSGRPNRVGRSRAPVKFEDQILTAWYQMKRDQGIDKGEAMQFALQQTENAREPDEDIPEANNEIARLVRLGLVDRKC